MAFEQPLPPVNAGDPAASFLSASCLDFLLIELVPTAQQLAREPLGNRAGASDDAVASSSKSDGAATSKASGTAGSGDEDEQREVANRKLEAVGYRVGQGIAERYV
jgi:E3 SUMO-protein ligase PIAS1